MAKIVKYYTATSTNRAYIYYLPDGSTGGVQYESGTALTLYARDNAPIMEGERYRVSSPMDGWMHWVYVGQLTPVYDVTLDDCTPPTKVMLDPQTMMLTISGGRGGDLNAMIGYQVQYRERRISEQLYGSWSASQIVKSSGSAAFEATVNAGNVRQYRVRTIGEAGQAHYSQWVLCQTELFSGEEEKKQKSGIITLHVFDIELNYTGRVENWISMTWEEEYQGEGAFTLTVPDTDKYARLLQRGCFLYRNDRSTCMMVVSVERNGENGNINIGGYTALHMLTYRMVYNRRKITNVESGIYDMVGSNLRGLPFSCAEAHGFDETVEEEDFDCPMMLDAVLTLIKESDLGIRMLFDAQTRQMVFEVYRGYNRTHGTPNGYPFSTEFGNLYSIVVTEDDDVLKNVAVVTGANPGCDKTTFTYESEPGLTGLARRELLVDGEPQGTTGEVDEEGNEIPRSKEDWKKAMLDKGKQALTEYNLVQTFEVKPYTGNYGTRYSLGDKVTCKSSRYGLRFDARITQVKETYDQNGSDLTITLGEPTINYIKKELMTNG